MTHLHAFHTSCRDGLSGTPGFQFNAASPGLSPEALRALAAVHAGYHAPPGCPPEPTEAQLADFPVALKHRAVEGVGPVVSRTVYVGRELRGRDGEPDSGRFGNYFSHIVLGAGAEDPFDGLLPIELWGAQHWTTAESPLRELAPLGPLGPGALDLDAVLGLLDGPRRAWLGPVLDAVLAALDDGPRVVVVEPQARCAGAWVAWASYALPPALAARLSFTTYSGRPRRADDVQLCVTTPDADLAFASYELGRNVVLLGPVDGPPPSASCSLYARVADALAGEGAEAVAGRVRRLEPDGDVGRLGAELAIAGASTQLARDAELPDVLAALADGVRAGRWTEASAAAEALPDTAGEQQLLGWATVHAAARAARDEGAQVVADRALDRLLPCVDRLPAGLAVVSPDAPTRPSLDRLARWLDGLDAQRDGVGVGAAIQGGVVLGLAGCNAALDRRVAAALADGIGHPQVCAAFEALAGDPRQAGLVEATVALLAERATAAPEAFEALAAVASSPAVLAVVRAHVEQAGTFAALTLWERLRVRRDPQARPAAIERLLRHANDDAAAAAAVRLLFGGRGPATLAEHVELLDAHAAAGVRPSNDELERAAIRLGDASLSDRDGAALATALDAAHPGMRRHPLLRARELVRDLPPQASPFAAWASEARAVAAADRTMLPEPRRVELGRVAGRVAVRCLREPDHAEGIALLTRGFGASWPTELAHGLQDELEAVRKPERLVAEAFQRWRRDEAGVAGLLDSALPLALADWSARRRQGVADRLEDDDDAAAWESWLERHPPERGRRPLGRLLGGGRDR
jgi:hypothetical protein